MKRRKHFTWTGRTEVEPGIPIKTPAELKAAMERQWTEGKLTTIHKPAGYHEPGYSARGYKLV